MALKESLYLGKISSVKNTINNINNILTLKRISKKRFYSIFVLSGLSIVILTYQTIEYFNELSCCGGSVPEIIKAFREYGTFLGIPISLFGILQMISTIVFLVFLSMAPIPTNLSLDHPSYQRILGLVYYLFLIELLISSVIVVNLIYIEFAVIKSFCLPCTISQIVIFSNTVLVLFWKPLEKEISAQ